MVAWLKKLFAGGAASTFRFWTKDYPDRVYIKTLAYKHRDEMPSWVRDWATNAVSDSAVAMSITPNPTRGGFDVLLTSKNTS